MLGNKGYGQRSHFSENVALEWHKIGHNVLFIGVEDIQKTLTSTKQYMYKEQKKPYRLSNFDLWGIDFIFQDQCDMEFLNDVKTTVLYNHKYVHRRWGCYYPDGVFFLSEPLKKYCEIIWASNECRLTPHKFILSSATETDNYKPREKKYKGISWFGSRNDTEAEIDHIELLGIAQRQLEFVEQTELRRMAKRKNSIIVLHDTPIPTPVYRDILPQCEAHYFSIPRGQFISRMMYESMACKVLCVIEIQSKRHEKVLKDLGFINGEHYLGWKGWFGLKNIENLYRACKNKEEIIENAYYLVLAKHLHKNRAEQILDAYYSIMEGKI